MITTTWLYWKKRLDYLIQLRYDYEDLFPDESVYVNIEDNHETREFSVDHPDFNLTIHYNRYYKYFFIRIEREDVEPFSPCKNQLWYRTKKSMIETEHRFDEYKENAIKIIQRAVKEWLYNPYRSGYGVRRLLNKYLDVI
jgi:hypothetical protein